MKKKIFFYTVICFQITVFLFAQTEVQKQMMYEHINRDSRGQSIMDKIKPIANKEDLFSQAKLLLVYKASIDKNNNPKLIQNKNYYLVYYVGRLYVFTYNKSIRMFENDPQTQQLVKLIEANKKFSIVYFTDSFYSNQYFLNPLISDNNLSFIIDKDQTYSNALQFIDVKYGSFEKYQEKIKIEQAREKLTAEKALQVIKNNYENYQYSCPKDTALVLKKMVDWVNLASGGITKEQQNILNKKIKIKIDPISYMENEISRTTNKRFHISQNERKENEEAQKNIIKFNGSYDYSLYGVNITNELLEILTIDQFERYRNYIDVLFPPDDFRSKNMFQTFRNNYSIIVLRKEGLLKTDSYSEYENFTNKILSECGCPFDETIKRELIIR